MSTHSGRSNPAWTAAGCDALAVPVLRSSVRFARETLHGAVLLAPERGYLLNDTAGAVVGLMDGTRSVAGIVAILSRKYAAPESEVESDVRELVRRLAEYRLLTTTLPAASSSGPG